MGTVENKMMKTLVAQGWGGGKMTGIPAFAVVAIVGHQHLGSDQNYFTVQAKHPTVVPCRLKPAMNGNRVVREAG